MKTIKEILDRHSREVSAAIKQRKSTKAKATLSKGERPKCKNCKYHGKKKTQSRCADPHNCTLKRFQGIA